MLPERGIMSSFCMLKVYQNVTLHLVRFRGNGPYERSFQIREWEWRRGEALEDQASTQREHGMNKVFRLLSLPLRR